MTTDIRDKILMLKDKDTLNSILIFADDAHISVRNDLDLVDYVPIIGRCSFETEVLDFPDIDTPMVEFNLQSALYNNLLGYSGGFIEYNDIPREKRLNHSYNHIKIQTGRNILGTFDKNNCTNWWYLNNSNNYFKIYKDKKKLQTANSDMIIYDEYVPMDMHDYESAVADIKELWKNYDFIFTEDNQKIFVAPWNHINDITINTCKELGFEYIIYSDVYDIKNNKKLGIPRINLERI